MDIRISIAQSGDLDEILTLQKIAYKSEAEIHDDFSIPPLHQTIDEVKEEFKHQLFLKAVEDGKIIGSVRAYEKDGTCFIGKLIVHPSFQNQGIGTTLLLDIEDRYDGAVRFELFTGYKSKKNLYLYEKRGYRKFKSTKVSDRLTLIYLEKFKK